MRTWAQNHLLDATAQFVACLKQNLCSVHEPWKPPPNRMCEAELEFFLVGWPCPHPWMRTIEWSAKTKAPTLLRTYRWLPSLVDRAQVLLETSHDLGCGLQEVILCSNFQCTLIAQSLVRPPSEEQSQLRSAEGFAAAWRIHWNRMKFNEQINKIQRYYKRQRKCDEYTWCICDISM